MGWNFYLDESGHDGKTTPLVVVGGFGIAVSEEAAFLEEVKALYKDCFGFVYDGSHELKGSYLLHKKKFKWAQNFSTLKNETRQYHAARFLSHLSANASLLSRKDFCGYGQACLLFVEQLFGLLNQYACVICASCAYSDDLKKYEAGVYSFVKLLERETTQTILKILDFDKSKGSIYFDESENSSDLKKLNDMRELAVLHLKNYGQDITFEMLDSKHSLEIQIADICIYCINWGLREYHRSGYTYTETTETKVGQLLQILDLSWINIYDDGNFNRRI